MAAALETIGRPFAVQPIDPGVPTLAPVTEPEVIRVQWGRGGTMFALSGTYHLVVTYYLTRLPTEVISD
jgi:hypothetical protein